MPRGTRTYCILIWGNLLSVAQQQTCRLCILSCSLASLFLTSSRFPFVVCPVSDIPAHPFGRKDSGETCKVSSSCFSLRYCRFLSSILSAVALVVIQHKIETIGCCLSSFTNRVSSRPCECRGLFLFFICFCDRRQGSLHLAATN